MVEYTYDSWGQVVSIKDKAGKEITDPNHIGNINSYRYRSYRYDKETKLYYLQSRYYNLEWGRFMNSDGTLKSSGAGIFGHNMYLYCANDSINLSDPNGKDAIAAQDYLRNNPMPPIYAGPGISNAKFNRWKAGLDAAYALPSFAKLSEGTTKKTIVVGKTKNNGHGNVPKIGKPNSSVKKPNGDIRIYGPDGRALKDIDSSHPERHPDLKNPHEHDWTWDENGKPDHGDAHNFADVAITTTTIVGTSYLIYRGVRMLPSLVPSLWWTIPINAATP